MIVAIYQCSKHPNFVALVFDDPESGTGTRMLGSKCCHNLYGHKLKTWRPTKGECGSCWTR